MFVCYECGEACATVPGWRTHMRTVHGQRSDLALWTDLYGNGSRCLACGVEFSTWPRLKRHLSRQRACVLALRQAQAPLSEEQRRARDQEAAEVARGLRRKGRHTGYAEIPAHRTEGERVPPADDPTEAESKAAGEAYRESLLHFFQGVPPMPRRQN